MASPVGSGLSAGAPPPPRCHQERHRGLNVTSSRDPGLVLGRDTQSLLGGPPLGPSPPGRWRESRAFAGGCHPHRTSAARQRRGSSEPLVDSSLTVSDRPPRLPRAVCVWPPRLPRPVCVWPRVSQARPAIRPPVRTAALPTAGPRGQCPVWGSGVKGLVSEGGASGHRLYWGLAPKSRLWGPPAPRHAHPRLTAPHGRLEVTGGDQEPCEPGSHFAHGNQPWALVFGVPCRLCGSDFPPWGPKQPLGTACGAGFLGRDLGGRRGHPL